MTTPNLPVPKQSAAVAPFEPTNIEEAIKLAHTLARSGLVPVALRQKPDDILVVLMKGRELGMAPMASLANIHVIDGKAGLSADAIQGVILRSGVVDYFTLVESTAEKATYRAKRKDSPHEIVLTYTIEMARAAGLLGKDNWKKYSPDMLCARCSARLGREVAPDVCAGLYDLDELDDIRGSAAPAGPRDAQVVDDGRIQRPASMDALKEKLAEPPRSPQDAPAPKPTTEPRTIDVTQPVKPQAAPPIQPETASLWDEDPFGASGPSPAPEPTPEAAPQAMPFPTDPADWFDPAKGGIDPDDMTDLELQFGVMAPRSWASYGAERIWIQGSLKEWLPAEIVLGSEGGKRHKFLDKALSTFRSKNGTSNPPNTVVYADVCLALMKKRWAIQAELAKKAS